MNKLNKFKRKFLFISIRKIITWLKAWKRYYIETSKSLNKLVRIRINQKQS